jgi:hypothetical protein
MSIFATAPLGIRPDDYHLPLFVHILGALCLVGSLVLASTYLFAARRDGSLETVRLGFRSLLLAALPSYIVMRVGAEWIVSKEHLADSDDAWIGIGYSTADLGALLIIISTVAAWMALRKARADGGRSAGSTVAATLVAILIVAYAVAIWAMSTKPI